MVATLLVWLMVLTLVVPVGMVVLRLADTPQEGPQRLLIAGVVGLLATGVGLLALSMLIPLGSPLTYAAIALAATTCAWIGRGEIAVDLRKTTAIDIGAFALAAVVVSGWASRLAVQLDTGQYHYQTVKWLREVGTVPGAGLFQPRFGFVSSWLPLTAPLDAGPLAGRAAGVMAGLLLLLLVGLWLIALRTVVTAHDRDVAADVFLAFATPATVVAALFMTFVPSLAPDFAVLVLVVLIAWSLIDDHTALAVLLAVLVAGVKLSAAPIVLVAGAAHLWRTRRITGVMVFPAMVVTVTVGAAGLVTSGCVAYPVAASCLEPAWGVTAASAAHTADLVVDYGRWRGGPPADVNVDAWLKPWFAQRPVYGLLDAGMVAAVALLWSRRLRWAALLALAGWVFTLLTSPNLRFNVGYLVVLLGVVLTFAAYRRVPGRVIATVCLLPPLLLSVVITPNVLPPSANVNLGADATPRSMSEATAQLRVHIVEVDGIIHLAPDAGLECWAAPIPCRVAAPTAPFMFRDGDLRSGFNRR